MKFTVSKTAMSAILLAALAGFAAPGMAQDKSTNSLESIHEKSKRTKN